MPPQVPEKLARAKMTMLMRRGLVEGCGCGCRGDWELTSKGRATLGSDAERLT
jgi:predicted NBD/HSP70 family sugar kinase